MAEPWLKYGGTPAPAQAGPWAKYGVAPTTVPDYTKLNSAYQETTDPGFFNTIGPALMNAPKALMDFVTGHPRTEMDKHFANMTRESGDLVRRGEYSEGIGKGIAAFLPGSGDEAVAAGEEFGSGHLGAGAAHTVLALAPFLARPLSQAIATGASKINLRSAPSTRGGTPWNPTAIDRLSRPEVKGAITDFIPYVGPSTGVKAKLVKLGKALAKNPETAPAKFDAFSEPVGDPWLKQKPTSPTAGSSVPSIRDFPLPPEIPQFPVRGGGYNPPTSFTPPPEPGPYSPPRASGPPPGGYTPEPSAGPYTPAGFTPPPLDPSYSVPEPGPFSPQYRPAPPDRPITPKTPEFRGTGSMEYEAPVAKGRGTAGEEPPAKMPKTPEEFEAAVQKAKADYEAKQKPPVGSGLPPMPGELHSDYTSTMAEWGATRAKAAAAKDLKVAQHLKTQGITPEQWEQMSLSDKNIHVKGAGGNFRALDKGGKESRGPELGANHIYNRLVELWK